MQVGSGDYEASFAWNSNGFSSYSESGSLLTEYLVTGSSVSEYDHGFDSSVDGTQASSTQHFTASGSELINYAVATQVTVIVPTDDGSGNSLDPITTIRQSESISVSGNAHAESDVWDLVHWAGAVENTSIAADGSQNVETEGVVLDAAIFTQNIFDETYSSTEQIGWEYASDTGLTLSGNQTSQSEVSGSLDIATDISQITTGADQLSTLGVLTNSFDRTFAGENANSSAYTLTKAVESDDIIAEYLSSSSSSWEVTDTNVGTYKESAPISCFQFEKLKATKIGEVKTSVCELAFTPGLDVVVVGGREVSVYGVNAAGTLVLARSVDAPSPCESIAVSAEKDLIAAGYESGEIAFYRLSDLKPVRVIKAHAKEVICFSFVSQGEKLVSTSEDTGFRIWQVENGALDREIKGHSDLVNPLDAKGSEIFSRSRDFTIRNWNADREIADDEKLPARMRQLEISPSGKTIATHSEDFAVRFWDVETRKLINKVRLDDAGRNLGVDSVVIGGWDTTLRIVSIK